MTTNWKLGGKFIIPHYDEDDVYLTRHKLLVTPWFAVYLHKIGTPDMRPTLHDHPWPFVAFVLRGGYVEQVPTDDQQKIADYVRDHPRIVAAIKDGSALMGDEIGYKVRLIAACEAGYTRPRKIRFFNFKRAAGLHYIETLKRTPTWTLVIRGPYARNEDGSERSWGYVDRDGVWTRHDLHPHAGEFDEAAERYRNQMRPGARGTVYEA